MDRHSHPHTQSLPFWESNGGSHGLGCLKVRHSPLRSSLCLCTQDEGGQIELSVAKVWLLTLEGSLEGGGSDLIG